jgi:type II secretory pathway pseudopilin PulG
MKLMKKRKGVTLVELMAASLVLVMGIAGMFGLWQYNFLNMQRTHSVGAAGQIARGEIEAAKTQGFWNLPLGVVDSVKKVAVNTDSIKYYDSSGVLLSGGLPVASRYYSSQRFITDSNYASTTGGGYGITMETVRAVRCEVKRVSTGATLVTMGTKLVRGGL